MSNLIQSLETRSAVKRMTGESANEEHVNNILKAINLAPTSFGLQPFKVLIIKNKDIREKMKPFSWNQPQLSEASHFLVFAAYTKGVDVLISEYIDNICNTRNLPAGAMDDYKAFMTTKIMVEMDDNTRMHWAKEQANIALGVAIAQAAADKTDAIPLGGFISEEIDKILGLKEKGLTSAIFFAIGVQNKEEDHFYGLKKVRRAESDLFETI